MADTTFTYGPANVTTLITTTMANRDIKEVQDCVFNDLVTINYLKEKNSIRRVGGTEITVPLRFTKNTSGGFYDGGDTINIDHQDTMTLAAYDWKQIASPVTVYGREERVQNAGSYAALDLVQQKIDDAQMKMKDDLNNALFASTPASTDLGSLVTSIDATSSIGDINSTTYSQWQSAVTTSVGSFSSNGLAAMRTLWTTLGTRAGNGVTDLLLTTDTIYNAYETALQAQQRYTADNKVGNGTFESLMFRTAPVKYDRACNSGVMYFLNSKAMELAISSGTDFIMRDWVPSINQDAKVAMFMLACELVIKNRRKLGKLTGIS